MEGLILRGKGRMLGKIPFRFGGERVFPPRRADQFSTGYQEGIAQFLGCHAPAGKPLVASISLSCSPPIGLAAEDQPVQRLHAPPVINKIARQVIE